MAEQRDGAPRPATTASPPTPDEVRAIVRRVVEATWPAGLASSGAGPGLAASPPVPAGPGAAGEPARSGAVAIAIGADHGGVGLKDLIGKTLAEAGYRIHDCGTHGPQAVDYPDFALAVASLVADGTCRWGIVVDGAGIGSCMVANKVPGVRAALCHDMSSARNSREHNHANVLTLGARFIGEGLALDIVRTWLGTDWGPGRHAARVEKIAEIERRFATRPVEARAG